MRQKDRNQYMSRSPPVLFVALIRANAVMDQEGHNPR